MRHWEVRCKEWSKLEGMKATGEATHPHTKILRQSASKRETERNKERVEGKTAIKIERGREGKEREPEPKRNRAKRRFEE